MTPTDEAAREVEESRESYREWLSGPESFLAAVSRHELPIGQSLRFGIFPSPRADSAQTTLNLAKLADDAGFELIGIQDHPYQRRFLDTWALMAFVLAETDRVTVFPDVANLPLRPPRMLAKHAASLDLLSGGRFELGLGAGSSWGGIEAMGGRALSPKQSVDAVEQAIVELREFWKGEGKFDCAGFFGPQCSQAKGPLPTWRHKVRATWATPFDVQMAVTWRHINKIANETTSSNPLLAAPTPQTDKELGSRDYFDFALAWNVSKIFTLRAGVNNIFDKDPPIVSSQLADPAIFGNGNTFPQMYDTLGRLVFVNAVAKF